MIDFIMLDDDLYYLNKSKKIIDKVMMNYDINYIFIAYDKYRKEQINKDNFKVYIISYKEYTIDLIKYIREELDDWKSLIIVLYENTEEKKKVIKENLFIVDYINKRKYFEEKILRNIQICLKNYDQRPNSLKYIYKNIIYNIEFQKILYIEKEQDNKRCIIHTKNRKYYIPGNLTRVKTLLDNRFIKINRSFIVNQEQLSSYDIKNNIITFKNNIKLNGVSRDNKKSITNYLRRV
ncbi:MAG: LytTR family transcriptional regulator DNA-binding domain-containing protein [Bacilli bacterium]|nr:LytTR family transcriptional regulator DNA-binding domain-containing protein [Bacilli bacterium]